MPSEPSSKRPPRKASVQVAGLNITPPVDVLIIEISTNVKL